MHSLHLAVCSVLVFVLAAPAWAQEPAPVEAANQTVAAPDDARLAQQLPAGRPVPAEIPTLAPVSPESNNFLKLVASDFKNFFSTDTARVFAYTSVAAVATAPWDREGVNNGFNIPTALFESGNLIGQFAFQVAAGAATWGVGKAMGGGKVAVVGRDIVRSQLLSQVMVQAVKHTVRRERPDGSNSAAFPSGHSASAFATAAVLHRHYGWKAGAPAYALGTYVSLARMAWNRHHATDVVIGAGFGLASARTVTMRMAKTKFSVGVQPQVGGASVNFTKIYN